MIAMKLLPGTTTDITQQMLIYRPMIPILANPCFTTKDESAMDVDTERLLHTLDIVATLVVMTIRPDMTRRIGRLLRGMSRTTVPLHGMRRNTVTLIQTATLVHPLFPLPTAILPAPSLRSEILPIGSILMAEALPNTMITVMTILVMTILAVTLLLSVEEHALLPTRTIGDNLTFPNVPPTKNTSGGMRSCLSGLRLTQLLEFLIPLILCFLPSNLLLLPLLPRPPIWVPPRIASS